MTSMRYPDFSGMNYAYDCNSLVEPLKSIFYLTYNSLKKDDASVFHIFIVGCHWV